MNPKDRNLNSPSRAADFIQGVLQLKPQLAVFDCDGTLWAGDAGFGFFDWELTRGLVSDDVVRWARARYEEYLAGKVSEDDMCAEMVTINRGLPVADVMRAAGEFFEEKMLGGFFPEMRDLVSRLHDIGSEVWAVSSTSEWVIQAGMKHFGIPASRILAAAVAVEDGKVTDKVIRVPSGKGKPLAIREVIARDAGCCLWKFCMGCRYA
jgi:phosphoserine phosphatase